MWWKFEDQKGCCLQADRLLEANEAATKRRAEEIATAAKALQPNDKQGQ